MTKPPAVAQPQSLPATQGSDNNPFKREALPGHVNAGAVSIEMERAIAEVQASLIIAKRFPRDPYAAWERVMEACSRPGLANEAFYSYKRGGEIVTGPSIRLAEEIARCWGNIDYGMRELSNKDGVTELEAYAWDKETNVQSTQRFTVRHYRDTKSGGYALTDQRDIYELGANMGSRRMRARILAVLPQDLVAAAEDRCRQTLKGDSSKPLSDQVKDLVAAFTAFNITGQMIERFIGKKRADFLDDDVIKMRGVYRALRDGAEVSDFFNAPAIEAPTGESGPANDNDQEGSTPKAAKPAGTSKRKPKAEPAPDPAPEPASQDAGDATEEASEGDDQSSQADDFDDMFDE